MVGAWLVYRTSRRREKAGVLPDRGLGMFYGGTPLPSQICFSPTFLLLSPHRLVLPDITGQSQSFVGISHPHQRAATTHSRQTRPNPDLKQPRLSPPGSVSICGPRADRTHQCRPNLQPHHIRNLPLAHLPRALSFQVDRVFELQHLNNPPNRTVRLIFSLAQAF